MTSSAPLLPPMERRSTWFERVRDRVLADPGWDRTLSWFTPTLLTILAGILRLIAVDHPREIVFDETYYVKDAWSLWTLGYEGQWDDDADAQLAAGDDAGLSHVGSFVVHPPLGKWLIALGMALTGPGSSFGWRLAPAVLGTLTVLLVYLIALRLTRSRVFAAIAGGLLAVDGLGIVMSRIALLDGILTFFLMLGTLFVLLDLERSVPAVEHAHWDGGALTGPLSWARPWLVAAGAAFGAASAVKWSGVYALAAFGLYVVVADALARRRSGVVLWPTDAVFRQGPVSFVLMVGPALVVYLLSWSGWLLTGGGYGRGADPNPLTALWDYHAQILGFHAGLVSGHPYASPAWQWPLLLRPTAVWVGDDPPPCGSDHCIAVISSVPNPIIWYGGVAAAAFLVFRLGRAVVRRSAVEAALVLPLVGLVATFVPWLLLPQRTIFQFYTIAVSPFLLLALVLVLRALAGPPDAPLFRRQAGQRTVVVYLAVVAAVSAFFLPVWTGMSVPYTFWLVHNWLPGWI